MNGSEIASRHSPLHMGVDSSKWRSTELANPHASDMESLHSMDGPKEALSTTAEVSASGMGVAMLLRMSRPQLVVMLTNPESGPQGADLGRKEALWSEFVSFSTKSVRMHI